MGNLCCAPMSLRPTDPSIQLYAPVTGLFLSGAGVEVWPPPKDIRDQRIFIFGDGIGGLLNLAPYRGGTIDYTAGMAYIKDDWFKYRESCEWAGRSLSFPLSDFQSEVTIQTGTCLNTGQRTTYTSCTCWPCRGCSRGAVDARVLMSDRAVVTQGNVSCATAEGCRGTVITLTLTMPNPQEFAEKLNTEIKRVKNVQ